MSPQCPGGDASGSTFVGIFGELLSRLDELCFALDRGSGLFVLRHSGARIVTAEPVRAGPTRRIRQRYALTA